jgi:hypothetical protein
MTKRDLPGRIQELMHTHGFEYFVKSLAEAAFRASDDTEDFENKRLAHEYRYFANEILNLVENMPRFGSNQNEDDT